MSQKQAKRPSPYTLRISPEQRQALSEIAVTHHRTLADELRHIIDLYIDQTTRKPVLWSPEDTPRVSSGPFG